MTVVLSNGQAISIAANATSGSVSVPVRGDNDYQDSDQTLTVSIAGTTGGGFEAVAKTGTVVNTVKDDADATVVTLSASAGSVSEGGSLTYTATLNHVTASTLVLGLS